MAMSGFEPHQIADALDALGYTVSLSQIYRVAIAARRDDPRYPRARRFSEGAYGAITLTKAGPKVQYWQPAKSIPTIQQARTIAEDLLHLANTAEKLGA